MNYELLNNSEVIATSYTEIVYSDIDKGWQGDCWIICDLELSMQPRKAYDLAAIEVRTERNQKLKDSDWTQLADATLSPETIEAWAAYRQALRDIPAQAGFPFDVTYPTKP